MCIHPGEQDGGSSLDGVLSRARGALGHDPGEHRAGFVRMVQDYTRLQADGEELAAHR